MVWGVHQCREILELPWKSFPDKSVVISARPYIAPATTAWARRDRECVCLIGLPAIQICLLLKVCGISYQSAESTNILVFIAFYVVGVSKKCGPIRPVTILKKFNNAYFQQVLLLLRNLK